MELAQKVSAREPVIGNWLALRDPAVAEVSAELGFDFVVIDGEHTPNSIESMLEIARAAAAAQNPADAIVRLSWNDPVTIKRMLDTGVSGVMAPMINNSKEAEEFVEATRYPPDGVRGIASSRANRYGLDLPDYVETSDEELLTIAQIETEEGMRNAEQIAAVDGLDAIFVGPADLSASLGAFGKLDSGDFVAAVDHIVEAAHKENKPISTLALGEDAIQRWMDEGFDFLMVGSDIKHIMRQSRRAMSTFEDSIDTAAD